MSGSGSIFVAVGFREGHTVASPETSWITRRRAGASCLTFLFIEQSLQAASCSGSGDASRTNRGSWAPPHWPTRGRSIEARRSRIPADRCFHRPATTASQSSWRWRRVALPLAAARGRRAIPRDPPRPLALGRLSRNGRFRERVPITEKELSESNQGC